MIEVLPQRVANDGLRAMRAAIAAPSRYAIEPKIDGVRGLIGVRDGSRAGWSMVKDPSWCVGESWKFGRR